MSEEKNTLAIEDNRLEEASFVNYEAMSLSELTKELKELLLTEQFFYCIFIYFSSGKYFFSISTNFSSKLYKSLLLYHFSIYRTTLLTRGIK